MIVNERQRIGGRGHAEIRADHRARSACCPRTHGSALFTRGETQALVTATLGHLRRRAAHREPHRRDLQEVHAALQLPALLRRRGQAAARPGPPRDRPRRAGRARALARCCPTEDKFPYTVRIVSEILESQRLARRWPRSAAAASSLMDAGVPIKAPVAGIAMGLIKEGEKIAILSDILGDEDHLGDMDFKVCGTAERHHLDPDGHQDRRRRPARSWTRALEQARGRPAAHPRRRWLKALTAPRAEISQYAPRITTIRIRPERIKDVIGPGGKVIKDIIARTGCSINIEDDGSVAIASLEPGEGRAGDQDDPQPHPGRRDRQDLPGHGAQDRRVRRLRGDLPGHRRPHPHLRALGQARQAGRPTCSTRATRCW